MIPRKIIYESDKGKLFDHFLVDIVGHDRYLRFGYNASNSNIENYLESSLKKFGQNNMWFVVEKDGQFVGTVHVSLLPNDTAEMGFTVSPDYRDQGLGQDLFIRGATWAMMKGAKTLYTQCLSENQVMQHIAKKNGMTVVTIDPSEKESTIEVKQSRVEAGFRDYVMDTIAVYDMAVRHHYFFVKKYLKGLVK